MPDTAVNPTHRVELRLAEDPRVTPLVRRLASGYWEIVRNAAVRSGVPIIAAWMDIYVDREGETLFFVAVHCDLTLQEARSFRRDLGPATQAWFEDLASGDRDAAALIPFTIVGTKRDDGRVNGA